MNQKSKLALLDKINDAFIQVALEEKNKVYAKYLRAINLEIRKNVNSLNSTKIKEIVMSQKINIKDSVLLFTVLEAITNIVNNQRLSKKEKNNLLPILAILGVYSLTRPKELAQRIYKVNKPNVKLSTLSANELKVRNLLNDYYTQNEKAIATSIKNSTTDLVRSNRKYATNLTKSLRKDLQSLVAEKKSIATIERTLQSKYQVSPSVIKRNLDTELHAQAETVKLEMAKSNGFTKKTWKTQEDSKVRKTAWHNNVSNKTIPIDSDFRAGGQVASRPGDPRLQAKDRIRCRCYLIYS